MVKWIKIQVPKVIHLSVFHCTSSQRKSCLTSDMYNYVHIYAHTHTTTTTTTTHHTGMKKNRSCIDVHTYYSSVYTCIVLEKICTRCVGPAANSHNTFVYYTIAHLNRIYISYGLSEQASERPIGEPFWQGNIAAWWAIAGADCVNDATLFTELWVPTPKPTSVRIGRDPRM